MARVGNCTREIYRFLQSQVPCTLEWNPGGHFCDIPGRFEKALDWLCRWCEVDTAGKSEQVMSCSHCIRRSTIMSLCEYGALPYFPRSRIYLLNRFLYAEWCRLPLQSNFLFLFHIQSSAVNYSTDMSASLIFHSPVHICWIGFYMQNYVDCLRSQTSSFFSIFRARRLITLPICLLPLFSTVLYISVESVSICRIMSIALAVRRSLSFPYSELGG